MKKPSRHNKSYWLISVFALIILIFGYSDIKYSGNTLSLFIPEQKNNLKLDLNDYIVSDLDAPFQEYISNKQSKESTISLHNDVNVSDVLPGYSLFSLPNKINIHATPDSDISAGSRSKPPKRSNEVTATTSTVNSRAAKKTRAPSFKNIFWVMLHLNTHPRDNKSEVANGSKLRVDEMDQVQYTNSGKDNELEQARINSEDNTQRHIQVGFNNSTSQTLINTFNSDLEARSIGSENHISQQAFNVYNADLVGVQNGSFNTLKQELYSKRIINTFLKTKSQVRQIGNYNTLKSQQSGISNSLNAIQAGKTNIIEVIQNGDGNSVTVNQSGSGNSLIINQQ